MDTNKPEPFLAPRRRPSEVDHEIAADNQVSFTAPDRAAGWDHIRCSYFSSFSNCAYSPLFSKEHWKQVNKEQEQLFDLIEKVRSKFDSKFGNQNANLDLRHCKWDQVMQEVVNTSQRYEGMSKTSKIAQS